MFEANAPDGTNVVHVAAEAIEDLTGNVPEEGYKFPYKLDINANKYYYQPYLICSKNISIGNQETLKGRGIYPRQLKNMILR